MATRITKYFDRAVTAIIPDPYEEPLQAPHANRAQRLLWYGHQLNLKELLPWKDALQGQHLTVLTGETSHWPGALRWTPEAQTEQLATANLVLIPTRKGVEFKSPNRLINALRAGCFPVCGEHIPSYTAFRTVAWVGNFATGMKWAQSEAAHLNDLIAEGQALIEAYAPAAVGAQWRDLIEQVAA